MRDSAGSNGADTKASIFVVEDEGLIAHDLAASLRKGGYQVAGIANSGEEALRKLSKVSPELILMDIRLGGKLDGIDLSRRVQEYFDVPIIYLTAHSDLVTLDRAKLTGPFAYLPKPVAQKSLLTSIELALYKHKAESELRQQRAWLHTILGTMGDGVIVTDNFGCVEYLNAHAEELTGWSTADAHRKPIGVVLPLVNLSLELPRNELIPTAIAKKNPSRFPSGLHAATRGGEPFPIDGEVAPSSGHEKNSGSVITFRNSKERLEKEAELRHEHKMIAVGRLAGGVAHDFNNLLTVIIGCTDMAMQDVTPAGERTGLLKEVLKASQNAASVTSKLLALGNKQISRPRPVNWNSIVRDHEVLCKHLLGPGITWSATLAMDLGMICADPGALTEVLINLVTNARDAMPQGGHLTIQTSNVDLETPSTSVPETNHYVALVVEDSGAGMDAHTAEHLFEPFFTTKFPERGTGLGLAIVDGIVRELGGIIDVDSEPGLGTTFSVYLPRIENVVQTPDITFHKTIPDTRAKSILLVEDDPAVRRVLAAHLRGRGYSIFEAEGGSEALKVAQRSSAPIDLLLTDVMMPNMTGPALAKKLLVANPEMKVVFISGFLGALSEQECIPSKNVSLLQKPFRQEQLLETVEALLTRP